MRKIIRSIAGASAFGLAIFAMTCGVQVAWSEEGLTGQLRTNFVESATRSCLTSQIALPANKAIPVSAIFEYCKCYANGVADKSSNDEIKSLEATHDEKKYSEVLHSRIEVAAKTCREAIRKTLLKSN